MRTAHFSPSTAFARTTSGNLFSDLFAASRQLGQLFLLASLTTSCFATGTFLAFCMSGQSAEGAAAFAFILRGEWIAQLPTVLSPLLLAINLVILVATVVFQGTAAVAQYRREIRWRKRIATSQANIRSLQTNASSRAEETPPAANG